MKTPCRADLEEAAAALRGKDVPADVCSRVATWLSAFARDSDDRRRARELGCSVRYLRRVVDAEARR